MNHEMRSSELNFRLQFLKFTSKANIVDYIQQIAPHQSLNDIICTYPEEYQNYCDAMAKGMGANYCVDYCLMQMHG